MKRKPLSPIFSLCLLLAITFSGCGGGDGGGSDNAPVPNPTIQVLPADYNFGTVTPGNSPAPLEVVINNNGTADLNVFSISMLNTNNFSLDLNAGSNPCISSSSVISAGGNCTVVISFVPKSNASFQDNLTIISNDPVNPTFKLALSGSREAISALNVRINQTEVSCTSGVVTAYVSVTDQGGYPVNGLTKDDFTVRETSVVDNVTYIGYGGPPASAPFVENNATISTALVMDYSASISDFSYKVQDMEEGAAYYVGQMALDDEAEIIKYGEVVTVTQPFTSDKNQLTTAIYTPYYEGARTAIFDACKKAVDDIGSFGTKDRRVAILISDGKDNFSSIGIDALVDEALLNNVPLFTIGLGDSIDESILTRLSDDTGGQFYPATTSENIKTVYQQLSKILFSHQYILTYNSGLEAGTTANLFLDATLNGPETGGIDVNGISPPRNITLCP